MRESSYYKDIGKYYESKKEEQTTIVWEVKFTRGNTFLFNKLPKHQEEWLLRAERKASWKIPDVGAMQKPFDGMTFIKAKAMFVIVYYRKGKTEIYDMPIRVFLKEKYESGQKSLTIERAREIGSLVVF